MQTPRECIMKIALLSLVLLSTAARAEKINWDHCIADLTQDEKEQALISYGQKNQWSINKTTGKVTWKKLNDPDRDKTELPGGGVGYKFTNSMQAAEDMPNGDQTTLINPSQIAVVTNADGSLKAVDELDLAHPALFHRTFKVKNGVCYPESKTNSFPGPKGGAVETHTLWNTDACRELNDFTKKNPEALHCTCGTADTQKQMETILKKYAVGFEAQDKSSVSYRDLVKNIKQSSQSVDNPKGTPFDDIHPLLKHLGTKPFVTAVGLLEHCEENEAVMDTLNDPKLNGTGAATDAPVVTGHDDADGNATHAK
jgi:hypothetical protein